MTAEEFLNGLEGEAQTHKALHHSFLKRFASEPLTRLQLAAFGLQHYQLVKIFPAYLDALFYRVPEYQAKEWIHRVRSDEYGRPDIYHRSHPALYRRFLSALGLTAEEWDKVPKLPEVSAFTQGHLEMTTLSPHLLGLGALGPGHEWSIPTMFQYLVQGLRKHPSLKEEDIEYFTLHIEQDVEHARLLKEVLALYAGSRESQELIREGACRSLELRTALWDGLEREIFGICW